MWIAKKDFIDAEYFGYILKAAELKYAKALEEGNSEYFYEVMFNYLNLNNLVLDSNMFDFKMKPSWKNARIVEISRELSSFYKNDNQSGETIKYANGILKNLCTDYLMSQCDIFDIRQLSIYYVNNTIHKLNWIYVIINIEKDSKYEIWRLKMDRRCIRGYNFKKIETLKIENIDEANVKSQIQKINNPELSKMHPDVNLMFCVCKDKSVNIDQIADSIKNTILLNKLFGNDNRFDPNLLENALEILLDEQILPFKISEHFL